MYYPSGQFPHSGLLVHNTSIVSPVHNIPSVSSPVLPVHSILAEHHGDHSADLISLAAINLPSLTAEANELNSCPCMSSVLWAFHGLVSDPAAHLTPQQMNVIATAWQRQDCLIVSATESGKSACYTLPCLVFPPDYRVSLIIFSTVSLINDIRLCLSIVVLLARCFVLNLFNMANCKTAKHDFFFLHQRHFKITTRPSDISITRSIELQWMKFISW